MLQIFLINHFKGKCNIIIIQIVANLTNKKLLKLVMLDDALPLVLCYLCLKSFPWYHEISSQKQLKNLHIRMDTDITKQQDRKCIVTINKILTYPIATRLFSSVLTFTFLIKYLDITETFI